MVVNELNLCRTKVKKRGANKEGVNYKREREGEKGEGEGEEYSAHWN